MDSKVTVEFAETPSYKLVQEARRKSDQEPSSQPSADSIPSPAQKVSNDESAKNILLTEEEERVIDEQAQRTQAIVTVAVFGFLVGGYLLWKTGFLTKILPKFK